jgi:hypothetical protein
LVKWTKVFVSNGWLLKLECVQYLEFRPHQLQRDPVAGIGRSSAFSSSTTNAILKRIRAKHRGFVFTPKEFAHPQWNR